MQEETPLVDQGILTRDMSAQSHQHYQRETDWTPAASDRNRNEPDPATHPSSVPSSQSYSYTPQRYPAMPQYTSRDVGDPSQIKNTKQSMADLKLRRLTELNNRLREDLERERIPVSSASKR